MYAYIRFLVREPRLRVLGDGHLEVSRRRFQNLQNRTSYHSDIYNQTEVPKLIATV